MTFQRRHERPLARHPLGARSEVIARRTDAIRPRHLTVVRGALVISGGMVEPKVFDACP
jgi:hypothetical protein